MGKRILAMVMATAAFVGWSQLRVGSQAPNCTCSESLDTYYGDNTYAGYFANQAQTFVWSYFACGQACATWGTAWVNEVCNGPIEYWNQRYSSIYYSPTGDSHGVGPYSGNCPPQ
jgi:hypothetical protein